MRLAVVSDTHGQIEYTRQAVRMLESLEVDHIIHCGDIGSTSIPPLFAAWPTDYVVGNVDFDYTQLDAAIRAAGGTFHQEFGSLELEGKRIAFLHSHDAQRFQQTVSSGEWDLVCYGHTHVTKQHLEGDTLVLNPGALYRANPHSFALVELPSLEVVNIPL